LTLTEVLTELAVPQSEELLAPHWEESLASLPPGRPSFLDPEEFIHSREFAGLPADADASLRDAAEAIAASPALLELAWHCHQLVYVHRDYAPNNIHQWPELEDALGELSGAFYLLILLSGVPQMIRLHSDMGIPAEVTAATTTHFPEMVHVYHVSHPARWGAHPRALYWVRNHTAGDIYQIGRFEYMLRPMHGAIRVYRHRVTREVIALSEADVKFAADGFVASTEHGPQEGGWVASLTEDDRGVTGTPISPAGVAVPIPITLPASEWELALKPGDTMLEMHIPPGGGMTLERCLESMAMALEFFPRHFPETPFVAFGCQSWILDPEIETFYRPDSNMVFYQKELYLYPIASGPTSGFYFVFGTMDVDPATAPRDTSLRRAILEHIETGGRVISSGMFVFPEDLAHFGERHYLSHWPPQGSEALAE